jgi:uncharacterized membrane protein YdbT with pleckstrin-like domain
MARPKIELHKNEEIFAIVQMSGILIFFRILPWIFSIFVLATALSVVIALNNLVVLLWILFLTFAVYNIIAWMLMWQYCTLIVTDDRVVSYSPKGLFGNQITEIPLANIKDIELSESRGLVKMIGLKKMVVRSSKAVDLELTVEGMVKLDRVADLIIDLQNLPK